MLMRCTTALEPSSLPLCFRTPPTPRSLSCCSIEYNVSYVYHALYAYFDRDNVALPGFAAFFKVRTAVSKAPNSFQGPTFPAQTH